MAPINLPFIDLGLYNAGPSSQVAIAECNKAAEALKTYGALVVRDPRANNDDNEAFLDLMEDYFAQSDEAIAKDVRPEYGYQVGATPEFTEEPKCKRDDHCLDIIEKLPADQRPIDPTQHGLDPKARFFWRMGEIPSKTAFPMQNMPPVIPAGFEKVWAPTLDKWGKQLHAAVNGLSEMAAVGFGLPATAFSERAKYGPHLLAPTSTRLNIHGKEGTIFAGFHTDLNFLTIHGKSRYPGLNIWARNTGERISVAVPDGCLLVQAGKQLQYLTGGVVMAGFHEVICTNATIAAMERRKSSHPDRPQIRISSTFFFHMGSDVVLEPLPELIKTLSTDEAAAAKKEYPRCFTGEQVQHELGLIELIK